MVVRVRARVRVGVSVGVGVSGILPFAARELAGAENLGNLDLRLMNVSFLDFIIEIGLGTPFVTCAISIHWRGVDGRVGSLGYHPTVTL